MCVCVFFVGLCSQVDGTSGGGTMVQKYQSPVRVYKQPFELVMAVSAFRVYSVTAFFPPFPLLIGIYIVCIDRNM